MPNPSPVQKQRDALEGIATLLAPNDRAVLARIALSFDDPARYLKTFAKDAKARGIEKPARDLPWVALIDGLIAARACFEIDWKTDRETMAWAVSKLRATPRDALKWMDKTFDDRSTWELLELTGQRLNKRGLALGSLDKGSDSYAVVVLPAEDVAAAKKLARGARYGALETYGKALAAATKQRIADEKKHARQAAANTRHAAKIQKSWRSFERGEGRTREVWSLKVAPLACDTGYESARAKHHAFHQFSARGHSAAFATAMIKELLAGGFAEVAKPSAIHEGAYIGWIAPFPKDARYFLESAKLVTAIALRGDTVWSTRSSIGQNFAELQQYRHCATPLKAAEEFERAVANAVASKRREISRAKVVRLYKA